MNADKITLIMVIACAGVLICMVFSNQIKGILKLLFKAGMGAVMIYLSNIVMAPLGISVGINIFTLITSAFLGIPGVVSIYAIQAIL